MKHDINTQLEYPRYCAGWSFVYILREAGQTLCIGVFYTFLEFGGCLWRSKVCLCD